MSHPKHPGCTEYSRLSRRHFLGLMGGSMAAVATPPWLPRVVLAEGASTSRDVLVSIFQRGGADSLSIVAPYGDDAYYALRPSLAIPRPDSSAARKALDLDGFFGFAPSMEPLIEAYRNRDLLVVHACGLENPTRSHFEAMHFMEVGMGNPSPSLFTGWLGRHLQVTAPSQKSAVLRAAAISDHLPRSLVGAPLTLPLAEPAEFGYSGDPATLEGRREAVAKMYEFAPVALKQSAQTTFETIDLLEKIDFVGYQPADGAVYPDDEFGNALKSTAALIKAQVGVEAIAIDIGGWDTHEQQGPLDGMMSGLMSSFASGLAAFDADLHGGDVTNVTTVAMSEFGRNAFENGSRGTDHGHGGAMLVMGDGIRGGQVLADWPGLARELLYEGQDLKITTDYRDILTEILKKRTGNSNFGAVFPDPSYSPRSHGIAKPIS